MIYYDSHAGVWTFLRRMDGSILPKTLVWAIPAALNAVFVYWVWYELLGIEKFDSEQTAASLWSSFTFVLGFLVVFRTQQAYSRYWEGATLVQQARANFFNCTSNLVAFCTTKKELQAEVEEFQHLLVRLVSMLQCVGLQTVADYDDVQFEFFNTAGIDKESLRFLAGKIDKNQRCEIVAQWVQRLIVDASRSGIIDVPAPILTRAFQELSQGLVHIINARIMTGIPFPFPYAQLLALLLVVHWLATPVFCALMMRSAVWSSIFTFLCTLAFWGANYIAAEIESPFGEDSNDLPLFALQKDMNSSLWVLLHPKSQKVPEFDFNPLAHRKWDVSCDQNFHSTSNTSIALTSLTTLVGVGRQHKRKSTLWTMKGTKSFRSLSDLHSEKGEIDYSGYTSQETKGGRVHYHKSGSFKESNSMDSSHSSRLTSNLHVISEELRYHHKPNQGMHKDHKEVSESASNCSSSYEYQENQRDDVWHANNEITQLQEIFETTHPITPRVRSPADVHSKTTTSSQSSNHSVVERRTS